ncbi:MAG: hypothetical protein E7437_05405 [Ruminococcaceae bacterium]|nr:hypothetical protein [Oscillospiraceae bacterium]
MQKEHITNLLITIETLAGYAGESCHEWKPDDNGNFPAEAFLYVIKEMATEAKGWLQALPATEQ